MLDRPTLSEIFAEGDSKDEGTFKACHDHG